MRTIKKKNPYRTTITMNNRECNPENIENSFFI